MLDISLLHELKNGKREALNGIFRYYYPKMMAYAASMIAPKAAEDIVQEVFLYIWENREKMYLGEGFQSYLYQATYTRCMNYIREKQSFAKYHSYTYDKYWKDYQSLLGDDNSVIENLSVKDFYHRLYELLEQLPPQRREVFILAYIKGMTAKEIAEQSQIPKRTVDSHLYLALRFLKEKMSKEDYYMLCLLVYSNFTLFANQC